MLFEDLDERWQRLDPVFVRGMHRCGTSILATALERIGIRGFAEGHLWFQACAPFTEILDRRMQPGARDPSYALGDGRERRFARYVALAVDRFHRDHLPEDLERWLDKSPGGHAVASVEALGELFPRAQFVFARRNGITAVHSGRAKWPKDPTAFERMCRGWAHAMRTWREVRESLAPERYLELAQEEMAARPGETASRLAGFLERPEAEATLARVFEKQRVVSSFPDRAPGDYHYEIDWSDKERETFVEICGEEMERWGYEIAFDPPEQ